jgi:hypothetical protein
MVPRRNMHQRSKNNALGEWNSMVISLAGSFHNIRVDLYDECRAAMTVFLQKHHGDTAQKLHADDEQGVSVKAFQVLLASLFIRRKNYMSPEQEKSFSGLLWAEVLGDDLVDGVLKGRMLFASEDEFPRLFDLFCRIGEEITGETDPLHGMLLLSHFGSSFMERCYRSIIETFSDKDRERTVDAEMLVVNNQIDFISRRFGEEVDYLSAELN